MEAEHKHALLERLIHHEQNQREGALWLFHEEQLDVPAMCMMANLHLMGQWLLDGSADDGMLVEAEEYVAYLDGLEKQAKQIARAQDAQWN